MLHVALHHPANTPPSRAFTSHRRPHLPRVLLFALPVTALLVMALLVGLAPLGPGLTAAGTALAAQSPSADAALPGDTQQDAPDGLQSMDLIWQTRAQELTALVEETDRLRKALPDMARALDIQVSAVQRDYQRLFALYQLSRNHPSEMAAIRRQLAGVQRTLQGRLAPMETTDAAVRQRLDDFNALDKELSEHLATERSSELSKDLSAYLAKLTEGRKNLTTLRTRLARALDPGHAVDAKLTQALEQIDAQLPALWRVYYLVASSSLMDLSVWQSLPGNLAAWSDTTEVRLATEFPQTPRDWGALLLRFAFLVVPLLLLGRLALRRGCRLPGGWAESCRNVAARSWPWIAVGIALHFASWARGGEVYRAVVVPAHLMLLLGELTLVWSLRASGLAGVPQRSPLLLLFAPAAIGVLLLFLNPPAVLLAPLWALCMVAVLTVRARRGRPRVLPLLEKVLLACEPALCIVSLLAAVLGWARLAIPFFLVALAVAVALQLGAVLVALVTLLAERLPEKGMRALLRGLVLGLGAPAMWVVAAATLLPWMSAFPGGPYMMRQALELNVNVGSVSFNSLRVLGLVLLFYLTRSAIAVGTSFLDNLPARLPRVERGVIPPLQTGLTYALWALFGLVVLNALGVSLTSLTVIAGGLSVGLGFGLQTIFNNFFSGLILIFGRSLLEGDIIQIGETWGTVRKISIRSTTVETFDNAVIFVPNSELVSNRLTNWTRNSMRMRRDIAVGVAYGSDIDKVTELLMQAADEHPRVMRDPAPNVLFQDFGPSSLDFVLRVWVDDLNHGVSAASDLRRTIDRLFRENAIEISFPQLDVHVRGMEGLPAPAVPPVSAAPSAPAQPADAGAAENPVAPRARAGNVTPDDEDGASRSGA